MSGSAALGILRLYILVHIESPVEMTPMRTKSLHVLVNAPPDNEQWGLEAEAANSKPMLAQPTKVEGKGKGHGKGKGQGRGIMYQYNTEESRAIWRAAKSYQQLST